MIISRIYKACLSILVVCIMLIACLNFNFVASADNSSKIIDMYLIGGQSNAAGYSAKGTLNETFSNIGYAGEVDRSADGSVKQSLVANYNDYKWAVTAGLGRTQNHIGPEYGMAKELNSLYAGENKAFIFKTATGSTSLRDITANQWGGNWYPRSLWQDGYTPNVNTFEPRTGVIYKRFIDNFKTVYNNLVAKGYTPVVRGMVWMQGEEDLGYESEYKTLLKTFITDIRSDLTTFTGDDLTEMPFVIGKIATTFAQYNNPSVPAFNTAQQEVANEMVNVKTVETSDLVIVDSDGATKGTDKYHFSGNDALVLGRRFAKKLLEMSKQNLVSFKGNNVHFSYIEKRTAVCK